jgi:hypothetical protein
VIIIAPSQEGIFRWPGSEARCRQIQDAYERGERGAAVCAQHLVMS